MAVARLPPAANLLRNSRLFSIPPPLTPVTLTSDTATQPHPTHAAIETPVSSWVSGDWGFKRSLPLKSTTRTGTTTIRVQKGIDSIEHITDFESAADHVLTLQKWKELHLPIRFMKKRNRDDSMSVFENKVDNISLPTSSGQGRWRYKGPWLAGQTGWEFDTLLKRVKGRKTEFQRFVRARLDAERNVSRRRESIDAGLDLNDSDAAGVTDEEFDRYMHYLRATPSAFGPLIAEFLDLPEGPDGTASTASPGEGFVYGRTTLAADAYKETGPPKTHPSAGISYYRSGAHVFNHPVYGPQQVNPPVVARVLRPGIRRKPADVGVAGFVISGGGSLNLLSPNSSSGRPPPSKKTLVLRPTTATLDSNGRVMLKAEKAQLDSRRVYGLLEEPKPREVPEVAKTRLDAMPTLDAKSSRERQSKEMKPLHDALENMMRTNGDKDYV